jgi:NitT/TauT family transport system substrate-binding protein
VEYSCRARFSEGPTEQEAIVNRHASLRLMGAGSLAYLAAGSRAALAEAKPVVIAEPLHGIGYLPLYVAIQNGYFKDLAVSVVTLGSGSAPADALLGGRVWGMIGGPEHNAYADVKGANLRAIVNIVNRGNVYFAARKGLAGAQNTRAFLKGKTIVTSAYSGTPNSITRYVASKLKLDIKTDITLTEVVTSAIPIIISQGKGDIAVVTEPMLTKGIQDGIWEAPFYNAPQALGPYAYSTINVTGATITGDAVTARAFVRGMIAGMAFIRDHHDGALAAAQKEFPDLAPPVLKAALQRAYDDNLWEWSGTITPASVKTAESVVEAAGLLANDVPFDQLVDLRFVGK